MERRKECLIRVSTGWDISFHPSTRLCFPHSIQIPPRAFSHRSSSHVFTLTRTLGFAAPPIFAANGIQFVYNYRKQSPTIFTLSLGMNQALYIYTVSCSMSSLLSYFMSTTLYFLSYPALSRLPIFPGQAAAVLQGLPIISRLSVII